MSNDTRTLEIERSTSTGHRLSNYDGACGNIHGHNIRWEVTATVEMDEDDEANMPVDLKDVSDVIDQVDHATILSEEDDIMKYVGIHPADEDVYDDEYEVVEEIFGDVIWFEDGDPTCEVLTQWMTKQIYHEFDAISHVNLTAYETDKYGVSASYGEYDELEEMKEE